MTKLTFVFIGIVLGATAVAVGYRSTQRRPPPVSGPARAQARAMGPATLVADAANAPAAESPAIPSVLSEPCVANEGRAATEAIHALVARGRSSVPAILALLKSGRNTVFKPVATPTPIYGEIPSLRVGLLNALRRIGGPEARAAALEVLPDSREFLEIFEIQQTVMQGEALTPHREGFVAAMRASLQRIAEGALPAPIGMAYLEMDMVRSLGAERELLGELEKCASHPGYSGQILPQIATGLEPDDALQSLRRIYDSACTNGGPLRPGAVLSQMAVVGSPTAYAHLARVYGELDANDQAWIVDGLMFGMNIVGRGTGTWDLLRKDFDGTRSDHALVGVRPVTPESVASILNFLDGIALAARTDSTSRGISPRKQIEEMRETIQRCINNDQWGWRRENR